MPSIAFVPKIFMAAIPILSLFSLPVAACLAVQASVGSFLGDNSFLMFRFLGPLRKKFLVAAILFSLSLSVPVALLLFDFAPKGYEEAKRLTITLATEHMSALEAGRFHHLAKPLAIFFRQKKMQDDCTRFFDMVISYRLEGSCSVICAKEARLSGQALKLSRGTVVTEHEGRELFSSFEEIFIDVERLLHTPGFLPHVSSEVSPKSYRWSHLIEAMKSDEKAFVEFHSRFVYLLWQLLLPLLALFFVMRFGVLEHSNLLLSIFSSGVLALCMHFILGATKLAPGSLVVFLLYGLSVLFFSFAFRISWF